MPIDTSTLILVCAVFLTTIYLSTRQRKDRDHVYWLGLSIIFFFLATDEAASIHELLTQPLHYLLHTSGILTYAWVIPYGALMILFFLSYLRFLFRLPSTTRNHMILSGAIYVMGALGFELVGGWYIGTYGNRDLVYGIITLFEEPLEMVGMTVFLYTLLTYIQTNLPDLSVRIARDT